MKTLFLLLLSVTLVGGLSSCCHHHYHGGPVCGPSYNNFDVGWSHRYGGRCR